VSKCSGARCHSAVPATDLRALRVEVGQVMQGLHLVARLSALDNVLIGSLGRVTGWRSWTALLPADEGRRRPRRCTQSASAIAARRSRRQAVRRRAAEGGDRPPAAAAPRLILADEPTAALDPRGGRRSLRAAGRRGRADATLLSVVHNPALLPLLAER
jgi:phosphonate transport system ATP-binding protein